MTAQPLAVLKIGGSLLSTDASLDPAVREMKRWIGDGYRLVVVVSAYSKLTDQLSERARTIAPVPDPDAYATFLSTGEALSVAALGLAARRAGIRAALVEVALLGLETAGDRWEADPRRLRSAALRQALDHQEAALVPGFVGTAVDGGTTLLGRGGSDMTAIFLASRLRAERCVLLKDVDGWFLEDPRLHSTLPPRYETLHWADAISAPCPIVQGRAVELAKGLGCPFEVAAYNSHGGTRVGPGETKIAPIASDAVHRRGREVNLSVARSKSVLTRPRTSTPTRHLSGGSRS